MENMPGGENLANASEEKGQRAMIQQAFARARTSPRDVWFEREDGKILTAFVNGDRAWLMYRRDDADAGFSSRDPDYAGPEEAQLSYILGNGQQDEYPVSWTISINGAMRAVEYFFRTGEKAPWVTWHDDFFPQECVQQKGKFLDVLANGDRAWLRYHRGEHDPGFTSRHPEDAGPNDAIYEFVLQNGQRVAYPVSWTVSKEEALRAYDYFLRTGEKAPWVIWHKHASDQASEDERWSD
jgi:hypothetical protein